MEVSYYQQYWGNPNYVWPRQDYHEWAERCRLSFHVDVGCGNGLVKADVYVDFCLDALKRFRGERVLASAYQLPFQDKVFDSSSMLELLEHLDRPEEALSEARRVTRIRVVISFPEGWSHNDQSHRRPGSLETYSLHPSEIVNLDHRWCIVECLSQ